MRTRPASRLIVLSPENHVLPFRFCHKDDALEGKTYWATLQTPCPGPALPGLPDHSFPVTDVKRETVPARMRPIEKSSLHQVRSRC